MKFRLTAFGLHLLASGSVLLLVLGALYAGWYRWPGWYLADVLRVVTVMIAVDMVLGPLLTLVVANGQKPRRELKRDISIIVTIQLVALGYASYSLWNGRPLYFAFSETVLQQVQAYDIETDDAVLARQQNPSLAPHWYSLPRWVWAPLPANKEESDKIMSSAIGGGKDVISMPRYFKPWDAGKATLRMRLHPVKDAKYFDDKAKARLTERMRTAGLDPEAANTITFTGRGNWLLAVFDLKTLGIAALLRGD